RRVRGGAGVRGGPDRSSVRAGVRRDAERGARSQPSSRAARRLVPERRHPVLDHFRKRIPLVPVGAAPTAMGPGHLVGRWWLGRGGVGRRWRGGGGGGGRGGGGGGGGGGGASRGSVVGVASQAAEREGASNHGQDCTNRS